MTERKRYTPNSQNNAPERKQQLTNQGNVLTRFTASSASYSGFLTESISILLLHVGFTCFLFTNNLQTPNNITGINPSTLHRRVARRLQADVIIL